MDRVIFLSKMINFPTFLGVVFILLAINVILIVYVGWLRKKYKKTKDKFQSYLNELDQKNERLDQENRKLRSKIKPQT